MSVQELAEKRVEEAPVKETKKSNVVQQKLISVIFI